MIAWDAPAHGKSRPYSKFSYEDAVVVMLHDIDRMGNCCVDLIDMATGEAGMGLLIEDDEKGKALT